MTLTTTPSPAPDGAGFRPLLLPPGLSVDEYEEAVNREAWAESRDPDLQARAMARCERDFYFWARRYCLIQNKATGSVTRLLPNAVQLAYERRRGPRNVILKQRKPGMSTWIDMRYLWRCLFRARTNARIVADTHDNSDQLFKRIHYAYENLPAWMKPKLRRGNVKELYFDRNQSSLQLMTAGSANIGRGSDIDALHCSECAVWGNMAAIRAGAGQALRTGAWLDWESTANGFGEFRDLYIEARDTDIEEVAHFFPWWTDPTYRVPGAAPQNDLDEREQVLVDVRGLDSEQIAWRRMKMKELKHLFAQEYPEDDESCFLSTGNPKYDRQHLSALLQVVTARVRLLDVRRLVAGRGELDMLAAQGAALRIWSPPKPGHRYVLGGDPSEGLATSDPCAIGVLDVTNKAKVDQVAEWTGLLSPHLFGKLMCQMGRFYNRGLLAPERNNHGHAVILEMRRMQRYPRIYSYRDQSQAKKGGAEVKFGFPTTEGTKHQMLDLVGRFLTTGEISVRSASFIRQAMAFRSGDEDLRDDSGGHFDLLIAWAIALYVGLNAEPSIAWAGSD